VCVKITYIYIYIYIYDALLVERKATVFLYLPGEFEEKEKIASA
jgi:hypothetical protein